MKTKWYLFQVQGNVRAQFHPAFEVLYHTRSAQLKARCCSQRKLGRRQIERWQGCACKILGPRHRYSGYFCWYSIRMTSTVHQYWCFVGWPFWRSAVTYERQIETGEAAFHKWRWLTDCGSCLPLYSSRLMFPFSSRSVCNFPPAVEVQRSMVVIQQVM